MTTVITQGEIYESLITSLAESCNCVAKHRPSQAQYCRTHDLDQSQFSYWKCKLTRTKSVTQSATSKFALAQVETITEHVCSSLTVTLPSGAQVEGIDEHNAHVAATLIECMS
ncbi:IS66 family insertion sequence element accessory protein TnpA [Vibrio campbellii]|uniref:IS66 family insertion sequence element accessory protein TnpA n=1 Tax=Vibrio campbellii TaxID=680 RepID=UPI00210A85A9|nr:IS66 family insertion sequence element accessory protein TnpB [Vibrio campbellii]